MIYYSQTWCIQESRDVFEFWEISDNILETVQDRDMVARKTNRKSHVAYRMAPFP